MTARILKIWLAAAAALGCANAFAAERPRLVINITVGSMQAGAIEKYAANFGEGGFNRLVSEGAVFTDARYDCMQTLTPVSLATLSTGTTPAVHGITGLRWFDYTTNREIRLTEDAAVKDFVRKDSNPGHSPANIIAPTLSDMLVRADGESRVVSIALDAGSSIVQTGKSGLCFWLDGERCRWTTSSYYLPVLPNWVQEYNAEDLHARFLTGRWIGRYDASKYVSREPSSILSAEANSDSRKKSKNIGVMTDYEKIACTPIGNTMLFDFAKYAAKVLNLGKDDHPDILNIYLDTSRNIAEEYGCESVEYEDMLYRLDNDLKEFLDYMAVHLGSSGSVVVVLTSDHGTAPAYDASEPHRDRFNPQQFEVIINAFLSAKYGAGEWVLGYSDRSLYLNRSLANEKRIPIADIQNEAAMFALQFRGVAHAMPSSALQTGSFSSGYGRQIQNGFYPRRSGDVIIDLMPEWVEERDGCRTHSGSMFAYDTRVPLIFWGAGIGAGRNDERTDMTSVAPTTARILGLGELPAAEGSPLTF